MKTYLDLLRHVLVNGTFKGDRTGTGTKSIFGHQMRFDLEKGFPLLTTKKVHLKSIIHELLWFLNGDTNIKYLNDHGVTIWNEWADEKGELGPIYGKQWRSWEAKNGKTIDQIKIAQDTIRNNPNSRRIIVSGWNIADLETLVSGQKSAPPPCHTMFQFYVLNGKLSCQLYQRSGDIFLGVPFNIASYALLTIMMAQTCKLKPGEFVHTLGDAHIYSNHYNQVMKQLTRTPKKLPNMNINPNIKDIFDFQYEDFELTNYNPDSGIKAPIAI